MALITRRNSNDSSCSTQDATAIKTVPVEVDVLLQQQQQHHHYMHPSYSSSLGEMILCQRYHEIEMCLQEKSKDLSSLIVAAAASTVGTYNIFSTKAQCYTLHYLCRHDEVPLTTLKRFIDIAPQALVFCDSVTKSTPLHIACWEKLPLQAIEMIMHADERALMIPDADGNLPLHIAASLQSKDVVLAMLNTHQHTPHADTIVGGGTFLQVQNHKNAMPLHLACKRDDISLDVIKKMIAMDDDGTAAAAHCDWRGHCPLHHACMHQADFAILEVLLRAYPHAVFIQDDSHLTPYGIVRKRWHWSVVHDVRVHLLQHAITTATRTTALHDHQSSQHMIRKSGKSSWYDALFLHDRRRLDFCTNGACGGPGSIEYSMNRDNTMIQKNKPSAPRRRGGIVFVHRLQFAIERAAETLGQQWKSVEQ